MATVPATAFLIHSGGLGAAQWRRWLAILTPKRAVVAPDLLGYGAEKPLDLSPGASPAPDQDLALLLDLLDALPDPVHLVGHSYGGLLAARLTFARPHRVRSLALFEPVLRGVLRSTGDRAALADSETWAPGPTVGAPGSPAWVRAFVEYWGGPGAFEKMSPGVREAFLATRETIAFEVAGIGDDDTPLDAYRAFTLPTLVARGEHTPLASQHMCAALAGAIPHCRYEIIAGAGHMAPISNAKDACRMVEELWAAAGD